MDELENPKKRPPSDEDTSDTTKAPERESTEEKSKAGVAHTTKGFWSEHVHDLEFVKTLPNESELKTLQVISFSKFLEHNSIFIASTFGGNGKNEI